MFEEREKRESLTFESEENEESEFIFLLLRVVDLTEETEMIVTPESVPILWHDVGEGVGDISRLDDRSSFSRFPQEEEEREDDTSEEDPFTDLWEAECELRKVGRKGRGRELTENGTSRTLLDAPSPWAASDCKIDAAHRFDARRATRV